MNFDELIKTRKSVRAYLDKEVPQELIEQILDMAKHAPSGVNMQPFEVHVVTGKTKQTIEEKLLAAFDSGMEEKMDYQYYPLQWNEPYKSRRKETGLLMYETLGITREDKDKQIKQWRANYKAFEAPVVLYFCLDSSLQAGSYLDYGMFLQSVMLAASSLGLATCTMAALAQYPMIVKEELHIDPSKVLLCGMALGYEDTQALINSYRTPRINIEDFTSFYH